MTNAKQLRGICQCCGRQQAVKNGRMSKHGYTVRNGWFNGVCTGEYYEPMEVSRVHADEIVAQVRKDVAALEVEAADLEAGKVFPAEIRDVYNHNPKAMIAWADAADWQREQAVRSLVYGKRNRANIGRDFADMLEALANERNGKPLAEVAKPAPAEQIKAGEKRVAPNGKVLIATRQDGARVYWRDERGFGSWTGSKRWRGFKKVEG